MPGEGWIRFEGYEGRLDPNYRGAYATAGLRYPLVERTRTWDIVRVDAEPSDGIYRRGQYTVLSRGHDMMQKAHEEAAAYLRHFKRCAGVGVCDDIGHPGGPRRARSQALPASDKRLPPEEMPAAPPASSDQRHGSMDETPPQAVEVRDSHDWVQSLRPAGPVVERLIAEDLVLIVIPLEFALWEGPSLGMAEDCNKRGGRVIGDAADLSCAEVEIVKRLRGAGWEAAWFQAWRCGRRRWASYIRDEAALPSVVRRIQQAAGAAGGHPDVIGWRDGRMLAIESKSQTDRLKESQVEWFRRARQAGVATSDTALVEWRVVSAR